MSISRLFVDEKIFSVHGVTFLGSAVIAAARRWGDWATFEEAVRQGLACAARADDTDDDTRDEALEAAADEFRYERDLISAQELQAWLERWSLDLDDWMEYLRRALLRQRWAAQLPSVVERYPVAAADIDEVLHAEAVCSGFMARMAWKLATRAAATVRARREGWLAEETPWGDPIHSLQYIDTGFQLFSVHIATAKELAAQIAAHWLDWIRVDCCSLALPTRESAKEVALCLREDGMGIDEVARNAGVAVEIADALLDDYDGALRDPLRAARSGEVVGPIAIGERFVLVTVRAKVLPSLDDPAVRRRAEERLIESALAREVQDRVEWHRADFAHGR